MKITYAIAFMAATSACLLASLPLLVVGLTIFVYTSSGLYTAAAMVPVCLAYSFLGGAVLKRYLDEDVV